MKSSFLLPPLAALLALLGAPAQAASANGLEKIHTLVVIYAENRSFDNLYGLFPGADGIPGVNPSSSQHQAVPQKDFDGSVLSALPPTWGGFTAAGQAVTLPQAQTAGWPNQPFAIDDPKGVAGTGVVVNGQVTTRDLVHRFYNNQMQIGDGSNEHFAAYSDAGGLTMGYYDGSSMALWKLARHYVLADHFFMGTFGGSFLNHQYLICACAPEYAHADQSPAKGLISAIDRDAQGNFLRLTPGTGNPSSVLEGKPVYQKDGALTPADKEGRFYAVNTMQPPYQPSGNPPAGDSHYADPAKASTLPPLTQQTTIGDILDAKGVSWAWYAGAWDQASRDRAAIYNDKIPNFQAHHQPFNYYAKFDPVSRAAYRAAHLKDGDRLLADAKAGKLPAVTFYKPQGNLNQHPGYANVADGDAHVAAVIARLRKSPQWKHMLIVVTYDENGGFYDHLPVPKGDRWGPGSRIPAILISPYTKRQQGQGVVDHTPYDTGSILRFITRRYDLPALPGLTERDQALAAHHEAPLGDLSQALDLTAPPHD